MKRTWIEKNVISIMALGALMFVAIGCGFIDKLKSQSNTSSGNTSGNSSTSSNRFDPPAKGEPMYQTQAQIDNFVKALTAAVGTDNPKLLKLSFYNDYAMAQVQNPNKPENVDSYDWRNGKLSAPNPVKIIGSGKISDNVFPLKDVNLAGLPDLTKQVLDKLKDVEGGKMIGYSIDRGLPFTKDIHITPLTDATRKSVSAQADKDAKLTKFEAK